MSAKGLTPSGILKYYPVDPYSYAQHQTDTIHFRVHHGDAYDFSNKTSVAASSAYYLRCKVGSYNAHWNNYSFKSYGGGPLDVEVFETPTISSLGSSQSAVNRNRSSTSAATMAIYEQASTSVTSDGSRIFITALMSNATNFDSDNATEDQKAEWILNANTDYLVKITNNSTADTVTLFNEFMWYEQTNVGSN